MQNQSPKKSTRRSFLETAGLGVVAGVMRSQHVAKGEEEEPLPNLIAKDIPVYLKPNGADLGSLYDDVMQLASLHDFE